MNIELDREKVAEELWVGADLPAPLNKEGERLDWFKRYRGKPNSWVRAYFDGKRYNLFVIKWKAKSADVVSAKVV